MDTYTDSYTLDIEAADSLKIFLKWDPWYPEQASNIIP